jgi:prepilin-type N-terminal cleavage/methylation domain-containing protein
MRQGLTLVEVVIVVIVLGILITFAVPQFIKTQEKGLDNAAKGNLMMVQAGENFYKSETSTFFAASGATAHTDLNTALDISLPPAGSKWNYTVKVIPPAAGVPEKACAQAMRNGYDQRCWHVMDIDNSPSEGACP